MRVRTIGLSVLAFGILIGAGGCSSESPTSPLAPSTASTVKGGYIGGSNRQDSTSASVAGGGYIGGSGRAQPGSETVSAAGGYIGGSN